MWVSFVNRLCYIVMLLIEMSEINEIVKYVLDNLQQAHGSPSLECSVTAKITLIFQVSNNIRKLSGLF